MGKRSLCMIAGKIVLAGTMVVHAAAAGPLLEAEHPVVPALQMIALGQELQEPIMVLAAARVLLESTTAGPIACSLDETASARHGKLQLRAILDHARSIAGQDSVLAARVSETLARVPLDLAVTPCPPRTVIQGLEAAAAIADWGRRTAEPFALLGAVVMTASLPAGTQRDVAGPWSLSSLLADATRLSAKDSELRELVTHVLSDLPRGALDGPTRLERRLKPHEVQRISYVFAGRELADVAVRVIPGSETGDVELRLLDASNSLLGISRTRSRLGHGAYIAWTPEQCGPFVVELANLSDFTVAVRLNAAEAMEAPCPEAATTVTR